ncbi:predicted protein [Histoplasma mississippiense (nom. inval.)]|uniref:predicted protein n=1 Tax=Ajellomyces capsulatus (strain NAm1 / WU24) TaxID=2059318 RepID=UPI000157BF8A|nr:predicted protein [Histoplasma mississippiense (nom. inval.)]EDN07017.1 predicted protein [Histoplasma mississippiense (nom. inval.)]
MAAVFHGLDMAFRRSEAGTGKAAIITTLIWRSEEGKIRRGYVYLRNYIVPRGHQQPMSNRSESDSCIRRRSLMCTAVRKFQR